MKVVFLRPQMEMGGATRHIQVLQQALLRRGHTVLVGTAGGHRQGGFERCVWLPMFPSTPLHWLVSGILLAVLVRRERADLIHSHHRFSTLAGQLAARLTGCPLVCTVHEFKQNWRSLARWWLAPTVITVSAALREYLIQYYGARPEQVTILRLGLPPLEQVSADSRLLPELLGGATHRPLIGFVGRLAPEKGAAVLLHALPDIVRTHATASLVVVGAGPERQALGTLARQLGVGERVRFVGERDDAQLLLRAMDVVAIPSLTESFGMTALEAMTAGRPVVASAVGGLPEMIQDGVTGRLVPPNDPVALADAISGLLANPQTMRRMGEAGRRKASEWSPDRAAEALEQIYLRALGRSA